MNGFLRKTSKVRAGGGEDCEASDWVAWAASYEAVWHHPLKGVGQKKTGNILPEAYIDGS